MSKNTKAAILDALSAQIQGLELGPTSTSGIREAVPLGATEIDNTLPWAGLPRAAVHEIEGEHGAALGFAVALLVRFTTDQKPALWCFRQFNPYAPGLRLLNFDPNHLIAVHPHRERHVLWIMEEALRAHCLSAVLGEAANIGLTNSRRLQLAAQTGNTPCLLLCNTPRIRTTTSVTRWRVSPSNTNENNCVGSTNFLSEPHWKIELVRCRGTSAGHRWIVKWCYETHCFSVVASLAHRTKTSSIEKLLKAG